MANVIGPRQWNLDTAHLTNVVYQGMVKICNIQWVGYTNDTDVAILQDRNGNTVWRGNGATDLSPVETSFVGWVSGIILNTLDAGRLIISTE